MFWKESLSPAGVDWREILVKHAMQQPLLRRWCQLLLWGQCLPLYEQISFIFLSSVLRDIHFVSKCIGEGVRKSSADGLRQE